MTEFRLPELGENIDQGELVRLMISPGASITEGQPVMELETDKAVVEVPSSISGTVEEIRVKEGEKVKVGQVIFTVENGAGGVARAPSPAGAPSGAAQSQAAAVAPAPAPMTPEASPRRPRQRLPVGPPIPPAARSSGFRNLARTFPKATWCG